MQYYVDIRLQKDTDISLGFIWAKLYAQMHLALVKLSDGNHGVDIGFAFPGYSNDRFLGDTLRVFAQSTARIEALQLQTILANLDGYVFVGSIQKVPSMVDSYVVFARKRFKSNADIRRLAKRKAAREGITFEKALVYLGETYNNYEQKKEQNKLPYINIKSLSTGHHLKLFVEKKQANKSQAGTFDTYGLSKEATLPWF